MASGTIIPASPSVHQGCMVCYSIVREVIYLKVSVLVSFLNYSYTITDCSSANCRQCIGPNANQCLSCNKGSYLVYNSTTSSYGTCTAKTSTNLAFTLYVTNDEQPVGYNPQTINGVSQAYYYLDDAITRAY